jgi:hypothetical protein
MNILTLTIKKVSKNPFLFLFFLFLIIFYRDFLYEYRMALQNTLGYWPYQNQILFYETGNIDFDITAPANLRFLGLITQYLIFKTLPCIELFSVNVTQNLSPIGDKLQHLHPDYVCATHSLSLMNYLSLCAILALTFSYCNKKLLLNISESLLAVLLSYAFLKHAEAFTLDRISILYLLISLYFLDRKYISIFLIMFSCLVNEKIVFIFCVLFFVRMIEGKNNNFHLLIYSVLSGFILVGIFLFYSKYLGYGYFQSDIDDGAYNTAFSINSLYRIYSMFLSPSGYSNTVLPLIFAISPYLLNYFKKVDNFYFSNKEILIPFALLFFTIGGGMQNGGRYIIYSMPIWTPILSVHICNFINKISIKNI